MTTNTNAETVGPSPIPRGATAGGERTPLYVLCYLGLPDHRKIVTSRNDEVWRGLDIEKISKEIGVSKQKISMWMKDNQLPGQRVAALIGLPGSLLSYEKLGPFIKTR